MKLSALGNLLYFENPESEKLASLRQAVCSQLINA